MISKKKLTALAVASLFVTPLVAVAQTYVQTGGILGSSGYLDASKTDFEGAIQKANNNNSSTHITVSAYGENTESSKNGKVKLSLTNGTYEIKAVDFLNGTGFETAKTHTNKFSLDHTSLKVTDNVIFRNAAKSTLGKVNPGVTVDELISTNFLTLTNESVLLGNVANVYSSPNDSGEKFFYVNGNQINTLIHVENKSQWFGDLTELVHQGNRPNSNIITPEEAVGEYKIQLSDNSSWTGGISILATSTVEVTLDSTSSWTVNKDSKINSIQLNNVATRQAVEKNGVAIADGVSLTIAEGISNNSSTINNLQTGAGSTLAVEKANVTLNNFAGKGAIVLNKDGKVEVKAATDKVNATFTSLDGSKLTTKDQVNANVTIAGALADEMGMDAVIEAYNTNKNFDGKGTITFSGGLLGDDVYGQNNDQNQFVQQGTRKNAQLVSIGESTAITMMQWRADADDMAQRMGDLRNNNGTVGVWARTFGGKAEAGHVDNKYYGVQAGVDTQIATTGPKQFVGGAVSYTTGDATFANGTGENYMGTLTGYSTWLFDNGAYVDVAAKWGKLNNEFDLGVEGKQLAGKYSTQAIALTVESGHRFPITNLTYVEPQVAFTASHIFSEDYGTTHGATIEQDSINSYVARVGVQAGLNCPDNMGSVFVRASYLYDFDGETSTVARLANAKDANRFDQDFGGGWYELGLGMNVNFTKNLYGYADFEYVTGGEIKTPYRWNAGLRYAF
ncbi:MAG: autotransporter outer membrane beta-barrel domain-containing protein [Sutterella wadsworthensis]|nr:autotransporter outer membrane beta-barrel domain-containing protein [Sutterella wadsworthensis]